MTHTPGPWTVSPGNSGGFVVLGGHPFTGIHATTHAEADARLIAAAPDLLAALEQIAAEQENDPAVAYCARIARAAIAKAKGEA